jgi:hypothetical protein
MNKLHKWDPSHSPYRFPEEGPYTWKGILSGFVVMSLATAAFEGLGWGLGYLIADAYSFALCAAFVANAFFIYNSAEHFYDFVRCYRLDLSWRRRVRNGEGCRCGEQQADQ